jgi:hypothetical protein
MSAMPNPFIRNESMNLSKDYHQYGHRFYHKEFIYEINARTLDHKESVLHQYPSATIVEVMLIAKHMKNGRGIILKEAPVFLSATPNVSVILPPSKKVSLPRLSSRSPILSLTDLNGVLLIVFPDGVDAGRHVLQLKMDLDVSIQIDPAMAGHCAVCYRPTHLPKSSTLKSLFTNSSPKIFSMPCQHLFCQECLVSYVSVSVSDPSRFPVRCCGRDFPVDTIRQGVGTPLWNRYHKMLINRQDVAVLNASVGQEYYDMLRQFNFGQCPHCGAGIEKIEGCNNMNCRWCHQNFYMKPLV